MAAKSEKIFKPGEYICQESFYDNSRVWKANHDRLILEEETSLQDMPELACFAPAAKLTAAIQPFAADLDANATGDKKIPAGIDKNKPVPVSEIPVTNIDQEGNGLPDVD